MSHARISDDTHQSYFGIKNNTLVKYCILQKLFVRKATFLFFTSNLSTQVENPNVMIGL